MERRATVDTPLSPPDAQRALAGLGRAGHQLDVGFAVEPTEDGSRVHVRASVPERVPFFHWFFGPLFRIEARRVVRWGRHAAEHALAGADPPDPPRPIPLLPPVAFTPQQANLLAAVALAAAIAALGGALFGQNIDPLARSFGVSNDDLGVALAVTRFGVLLTLVATAAADRRGRRIVILASLVVVAVGNALSAIAPGIVTFTLAQVFVRAAVNGVIVVGGIAAVEEAPEDARAFALAMMALAAGAGYAVSVVMLPLADIGDETWRIAFGVSALAIFAVPMLARTLTETGRYHRLETRVGERGRFREVIDLRHRKRFVLLAGAAFLTNVFSAPSAQFTNRYLLDERGFSNSGVALFRGVTAGVPGLAGIVIGGRLAESRGRRPVAVISLLIGTACTVGFFLGEGALLWFTQTLAILAAAPATLAVGSMDAELFPTEVRGTSNALLLVAYVAGSAAGLVLAGALSDPLGGLGYSIALCGIAPVIAAIVLLPRLPESRGRLLDDVSPSEL